MTHLWLLFAGLAVGLVCLETLLAQRQAKRGHAPAAQRASDLALLGVQVASVALFGAVVWQQAGPHAALAFASGWVLEQTLSIDNLFVFLLIFRSLAVPPVAQARVLRWGIAGAVILRGAFIALGLTLVERLAGIFYVFGAILVVSAIKVWVGFFRGKPPTDNTSALVTRLGRWLPLTATFADANFFVREGGRWRGTPVFVALVAIELGDLMFAVDSVPAVLSVTQDPLWVASSNLFAILGLRTMFRLLGQAAQGLHYLEVGLGAILLFVGAKMLLFRVVELGAGTSLAVVMGLFAIAVAASLWHQRQTLTAAGRPPPR